MLGMGDNPQGETKTISTHLNPPSQGGFEVYMSLRGAKRRSNHIHNKNNEIATATLCFALQ